MTDGQQLFREYVATGSEPVFRELVACYLDLVHSAARRLVNGDEHAAEDVAQTVFADLVRLAPTLDPEVRLGGWLHRHTCYVASHFLRGERRRQNRERLAVAMHATEDHSAENLARLAPLLDEAIDQLEAEDRTAILLRFFEQMEFRAVGETMGSSEEAARKRVHRALEKLEGSLQRRGVVLPMAVLTTVLTASAVQAAPVGLAATIATSAFTGAATLTTTTATTAAAGGKTLTVLKLMSMTQIKAGIVGVIIAAGVATPFLWQQHNAQAKLQAENQALQAQVAKSQSLAADNARLNKLLADARSVPAPDTNAMFRELMKSRGEVSRLRSQNDQVQAAIAQDKTNTASAFSEVTSNPEMRKMLREQQKMGMQMLFGDFAKQLKLTEDQTEKLNSLLADDVMENVDLISSILQNGTSGAEMKKIFADQATALREKLRTELGEDGLAKYDDYSRQLNSRISAETFKAKITGDKKTKDALAKQLGDVIQEETKLALANAGLDENFQVMPVLNFENFASEEAMNKNLALLEGIYQKSAVRAGTFLSPEDVKKFEGATTQAIGANRTALLLNRKMMTPVKK